MKHLKLVLWLLLACIPASAQTTVNGNVTDAGSQAWFGGTWSIRLIPLPGNPTPPQYFIGGSTTPVPNQTVSGTMDASANFTQILYPNSQISPPNSTWQFIVCPQATSACFVQNVRIAPSTTQAVNLVPAAIAIDMRTLAVRVAAYADAEATNAQPGQFYWNITSATSRICVASPCSGANWTTLAGAAGNPASPSGSIQYNNSSNFGGIAGSSVTPATGATTLTAGADTTTPLAIASHSNTQSATELDVNNQSSGTPDTPFVVRGRGMGSFTPSGAHAMIHVIQESDALAHSGLSITNHTADVAKGIANYAGFGMGVNDSGIAVIAGGGVVGDAANNYWCLQGDANESLSVFTCNAASGAAIVPFYVKGATSQTADLFEAKDVSNNVLAKIDKAGVVDGLLDTIVTTGTSANLCTDLSQLTLNQEGTAGQAVTYTLCTAGMGKRQCVMNSNGGAANTGILTVATSAAGQFIIFTDGTLSASGGNVTSGGAGGDGACFYGVDSTHWQMTVQQGTWTKH